MHTDGSRSDEQSNEYPEEPQVSMESEINEPDKKPDNALSKKKKKTKKPMSDLDRRIMTTELAHFLARQKKKVEHPEIKCRDKKLLDSHHPHNHFLAYHPLYNLAAQNSSKKFIVKQSANAAETNFDMLKESLKSDSPTKKDDKRTIKNEVAPVVKKRGRPKLIDQALPIVAKLKPELKNKKNISLGHENSSAEDQSMAAMIDPSLFNIDGKGNYYCPFAGCSKHFPTLSRVKRHYVTHTGLKIFKCPNPKCNRHFGRSDNMLQHFRNHCKITKKELLQSSKSGALNIDSPVGSSTVIKDSALLGPGDESSNNHLIQTSSNFNIEMEQQETESSKTIEAEDTSSAPDDELFEQIRKKRK